MTQTIDGLLEKNANQTEADRRVVDENITALKDAGAAESAREAIRVLCSASTLISGRALMGFTEGVSFLV